MKQGMMLNRAQGDRDNAERRKAERVIMRVPVIVYKSDTGDITSLYFSENVSKEGMFILSTRDVFNLGDKVYMEFAMPLQVVSRRIRLIGKVVRKADGDEEGYGIRFEKMFEKDCCFLKSYLAGLKRQN